MDNRNILNFYYSSSTFIIDLFDKQIYLSSNSFLIGNGYTL